MKLLESITSMFTGFSEDTFFGKAMITIGALGTAYLCPIVGLLAACFTTTMVDLYYGIRRTKKLGQKITSRQNWKGTLLKIKDEFVLVLLAHMIEFVLLGEEAVFYLSGGVTVIITLTELWSIIENLNTIDPTGPWRMLGKFLRKKGEDYIGVQFDEDDKNNYVPVDKQEEAV